MSIPAATNVNDPAALAGLKREARTQSPQALREVARQFESLFTRMLLKSMREASFGDSLTGGDGEGFYRDMYDDQLAVELSKGSGLGLAEMLVEQLTRARLGGTSAAEPATAATAATPAVPATAAVASDAQQRFVDEIWPQAEAAGRALGVDPTAIVAQAALETGWGQHMPRDATGASSFNLFGIKAGAGWRGASVDARTQEYLGGAAETRTERFRAYGSSADSLRDYTQLIGRSPRYAEALAAGGDARAFGAALQQAGYATDPEYGNKLAALAGQVTQLRAQGALKNSSPAPMQRFDRAET